MRQPGLIQGIIAPTLTPFNKDGSVNFKEYQRLTKYITENGANGVFVCGTTGEFINLTNEERKDMLVAAKKSVTNDSTVIFNVTAMNLSKIKDLCKWAKIQGADAVSATAPYYHRYDEEALVTYFCKVSELAGDLPFYMYNISGMTGNPITASVLKKVVDKCPNVCGIKDSSMDFMVILNYQCVLNDHEFRIFTGNDAQILTTLQAGGAGAVIAMAGVFPVLCAEIFNKYYHNDLEGAKVAQMKVHKLRNICRNVMPIMAHKKMLELQGFNMGCARFPMRELTNEESIIIEHTVRGLELI